MISGYDEAEFARRLHYDQRPLEPSLLAFRGARETSADLLDRLGEADWNRVGSHSESGPYGVETWLEVYAAHGLEHAAQITTARESAAGS